MAQSIEQLKARLRPTEKLVNGNLLHITHTAGDFAFDATEKEQAALSALENANWGPEPLFVEIHAIHGEVPTLNHTLFPNESLMGDGKTTGFMSHVTPIMKPLILDHNTLKVENTIGRCHSASYVMDTENPASGVIVATYAVYDEEAKKKILSGQYLTTSIGALTDHFYCSICGADWLSGDVDDCDHYPGMNYDGEVCNVKTGTYWNLENSFVICPADQRAGVRRVNLSVGLGAETYQLGSALAERLNRTVVPITQGLKAPVEKKMDQTQSGEDQTQGLDQTQEEVKIDLTPITDILQGFKDEIIELLTPAEDAPAELILAEPVVEETVVETEEESLEDRVQRIVEAVLERMKPIEEPVVETVEAEEPAEDPEEAEAARAELQQQLVESMSLQNKTASELEEDVETETESLPTIPRAFRYQTRR